MISVSELLHRLRMNDKTVSDFVKEQLKLLELEKFAIVKAEKEDIRENGKLVAVEVIKISVPNYGGTIVNFCMRNPNMKQASIKKGENIALCNNERDFEPIAGIVTRQGFDEYDVQVHEDRQLFIDYKKWDLIKLPNIEQYDEMKVALEGIQNNATPLKEVLFGLRNPSFKESGWGEWIFKNQNLDKSQKEAVIRTMKSNELSVVHGPPGTGKTTTLAEIVWQVCLLKLT